MSEQRITQDMLNNMSKQLQQQSQQKPLLNAVQNNGVKATALNPASPATMQHTFSHEIKTSPATNQMQSGRCWLFAGLNTLRQHIKENYNLSSFELSQNYLTFWDNFEKANYFLENIIDTVTEDLHSRLVSWLVTDPLQDGGQWDMFVNLVEKYGVLPKYAMPETYHSSRSRDMNAVVTAKLREDAHTLRRLYHEENADTDKLREEKNVMLADIYQMFAHFLGEPPQQFDFEYRDKDDNFHRDLNVTPQDFYKRYVQLNLSDYVSIINAPTADKPYHRTYTVNYLGNVKGGQPVHYLNVDINTLKQVTLNQLKNDEPVWFGCDVGQQMDRELGIMDTALYDYAATLGTAAQLSKAEQLDYGESLMTHAMVLTGVNLIDNKPNRWKVENSWGEKAGNDGYFVMSDDWFDQYMYQVVVKKADLPQTLKDEMEQEPIALDPWDPMGSLA